MESEEAIWIFIILCIVMFSVGVFHRILHFAYGIYRMRYLLSLSFVAVGLSTFFLFAVVYSFEGSFLVIVGRFFMYGVASAGTALVGFYRNIKKSGRAFGAFFTVLQYVFCFLIGFCVVLIT